MEPNQNPYQPPAPQFTPPPNQGGMYPGQLPQQPNGMNQPTSSDPEKKKKLLTIIPVVLTGLLLIGGISFMVISGTKKEDTTIVSNQAADFSSYNAAYDQWRAKGVADFEPDEKEKTLETLTTLASDFSFEPTIEADMVDRLIALGIAKAVAENRLEPQVAKLRLYQLFQEKLASVPVGITDENANLPDADETRAIYEKFQNQALTEKVKTAIAERGLEDKAKTSLKLTDEVLNEYELFALNFNTGSEGEDAFREEMGYTGWIPSLWTQSFYNARFIGFTEEFAQRFVKNNTPETDALFLHEFSHTQFPLVRGDQGLLLEERRAEEVSGNKGAYYDVKQFFIYLEVLTGVDVLETIQKTPAEPETIYGDLYSTLGVEVADLVVSAYPVAYLGSTTPVKDISQVQNLDTALKAAKKYGEAQNPDTQLKRIKDRAKRLVEIFGSSDDAITDLESNLAQKYQMPFVAELMKQTIKNP